MIDLVNTKEDEVELDFKLFPSATPNFVWGVVKKDNLAKVKEGRWDLVRLLPPDLHHLDPTLLIKGNLVYRHLLGRRRVRYSGAVTVSCPVSLIFF